MFDCLSKSKAGGWAEPDWEGCETLSFCWGETEESFFSLWEVEVSKWASTCSAHCWVVELSLLAGFELSTSMEVATELSFSVRAFLAEVRAGSVVLELLLAREAETGGCCVEEARERVFFDFRGMTQ